MGGATKSFFKIEYSDNFINFFYQICLDEKKKVNKDKDEQEH